MTRFLAQLAGTLHRAVFGNILCLQVAPCRVRCALCPWGRAPHPADARAGMMSFDLFGRIVDKFAAEEVRLRSLWFNLWCEPLLNPDLCRMIRYGRERLSPPSLWVGTSLNHLEDPEALLGAGATRIAVTVSGMTQETYGRNHRGGDIGAVLANLRALAQAKRRLSSPTALWLRYLDLPYNRGEAALARRFCAQNGVVFEHAHAYVTTVDDCLALREGRADLQAAYEGFLDMAAERSRMRELPWPGACWLRDCQFAVTWDGRLLPCCGVFDRKHELGSLFDRPLRDLRRLEPAVCRECARTPVAFR